MTEEDPNVMKILHGNEEFSEEAKKARHEKVKNSPLAGIIMPYKEGDGHYEIIQADLDREMEERNKQSEVEEMVDPDEVLTLTFKSEKELQLYIKEKVGDELRAMTPEQFYYLAVGLFGGDNALQLEFEKMSKNTNYEVLTLPKSVAGKYFVTLYRKAESDQRVVVFLLPPKRS